MIRVKFLLRIKLIVLILFLINCSSFQFSRHDGFWDWYKGKPGLINTMGVEMDYLTNGIICSGTSRIYFATALEERHPFFLHFKTPELFWNWQGGVYYPDFIRYCKIQKEGDAGKGYLISYSLFRGRGLKRGDIYRKGSFPIMAGGLQGTFDTVIPYRTYTAKDFTSKESLAATVFGPLLAASNLIYLFYIGIPLYVANDIIKIPLVPVAATYYLTTDPKEIASNNGIEEDKLTSENWNLCKLKPENIYRENGIPKIAIKLVNGDIYWITLEELIEKRKDMADKHRIYTDHTQSQYKSETARVSYVYCK